MKRTRSPKARSAWREAYTLTEMLVVLVIIGLLAAIVGPRLFTRLDDAKHRTARLQLTNLETAIDLFRLDVGRLPTPDEGLDALVAMPVGADGAWLGPYLARGQIPKDPWGHDYAYVLDQAGGRYQLMSFGADGREGGEGGAGDVVVEGQDAAANAAEAVNGQASSSDSQTPQQ